MVRILMPDIEIIYERMEIYGLLGQILVLLFLLLLPWRWMVAMWRMSHHKSYA